MSRVIYGLRLSSLSKKLRKDLEEARIQHDATCVSMKKKQQDAVAEMAEQIDQLGKMKAK